MQKLYYGFYFAGLAAVNAVMWLYVITLMAKSSKWFNRTQQRWRSRSEE